MDFHQIGITGGVTSTVTGTAAASGSYPQEEQSSTSTPSSSISPLARHPLQRFQQPRHHIQQHSHQQHQHQLYNLLPQPPPPPSLPQASYSPTISLPPISTHSNSQYLDRDDGSSSSWPRPRDLQHQHQVYQPQQSNVKRETMGRHLDAGNESSNTRNTDDSMPSTSDFVKKLYKMLEDSSFQKVVSWGPLGDCFVVKDMNEFTKSILPRLFKHSNFASFVRQLNKYDFHKVKNTDDTMFGEHSWTFRHPDFHADRREALENIKRKVPAQRKTTNVPNSTTTSLSSSNNNNTTTHHYHHHSSSSPSMRHNPQSHSHHISTSSPYPRRSPSPPQTYSTPTPNSYLLTQEISELKTRLVGLESNFETRLSNLESGFQSRLRSLEMGYEGRMRGLEKNYESVLVELVAFQRGVAQQDGVMKSLIRCFLGEDSERSKQKALSTITANQNLTSMTTSGLLLPSVHASTSSARMEDGSGRYQRRQSHDQNQSPSLPFSQSQSQPLASPRPLPLAQSQGQSRAVAEAPPLSDRSVFLPQDTVQRILSSSSTTTSPTTSPATARGGNGNENLRWSGRTEFDDSRSGADRSESETWSQHAQSQSRNQGQQKMTHLEAVAQIIEYHQEGLAKSMGRKSGADVDRHERTVGRGRDRDGDGDERGKRKRRDSDAELELGNRHGPGQAYSSSQQQQTFTQPTASSSSTSTGPSTSATTSSAVPWSSSSSKAMTNVNEGSQAYTVDHLMQRNTLADEGSRNWSFETSAFSSGSGDGGVASTSADANASSKDLGNFTYEPAAVSPGSDDEDVEIVPPVILNPGPSTSTSTPKISTTSTFSTCLPPPSTSSFSSSSSQKKLQVRRATFVPGRHWAVSPRVLLVDDDAVIRKLSSKLLKIFGCTTDIAVDGIGAVTKMNLEKYDLVLMDILMPKLDGISATNLIRKFDRGTPIISMTINSKPDEIMEYYSSGMNDILPKPFTKQGLLDMLEKHLMHLKVMQQMTVIPRSVGVPPLSDTNFEQVLMTNAMMVQQQQQQMQQRHSTTAAGLLVSGNTEDADSTTNTLSSTPMSQQQQLVSQRQPSPISFTSLLAMGEDDERINNPLAGMGLSDEHYNMILQNLVNGERFMGMGMDGIAGGSGNASGVGGSGGMKRSFDDAESGSSERGGKRSRFEVIE